MSSTTWPPPFRQPAAEIIKEEDTGLTQSLSQLSLKAPPSPPQIVESKPRTRSKSRHSSASPRRARSPSHGRHSRASTPPLLRKASMNSLHSANGGKTSRRSSFVRGVSPSAAKSPVLGSHEEHKPPMTASSVASAYFEAELAAHHGPEATLSTETVVILHDSVYGHRWSRPRTSRSTLSTIVERPERIKASVLGVSMAYVRLGDRHSDGTHPVHPKSDVHAIPRIPFRVQKTTRRVPLTSQAVTNVHGTKWMDELKYMCETAEAVLAMGGKELQRPDIERDEPAQKFHEGDLYLCGESLDAMEGALGAVCDAVDIVMDPNTSSTRAFVGVRPPGHHCSAAHPSGFCWVNNVHVGIMHAILTHGLTHAAIIDFDLHHGDGSQAITWEHNSRAHYAGKSLAAWKKTSIGYFSLHDINSYPCEMGDEEKVKNASLCIDNAHGQSIWNVHLQPWKTEQEFWEIYETKYSIILEKTRNYLRLQAQRLREDHQVPKAVIFFSAGFDASEWESAGMQRHQVNVPTEFYARLTQDIVKIASEEGLGTDGRVISVLEGGYSDRALFSGTFSHLSGLVADQTAKAGPGPALGSSLAVEMSQKLGTAPVDTVPATIKDEEASIASLHRYDPNWWSSAELDKLEELMAGPASPQRKPRTSETPAYFTPTAASAARVVDPVRMRRSLSGLSANRPKIVARPASPVVPEVPWMVAAHELSKLLIPADRQTDSCKAEELNAEASKARREKQATLMGITPMPSMPEAPPVKMSLRERKPRAFGSIDGELDGQRSAYSTPRRASAKTPKLKNADAGCTPRPSSSDGPRTAGRRSSRRLSATPGPFSPDRELEPVPPLPQNVDELASNASRPESAAAGDLTNITVKKTRSKSQTRKEAAPPKTPRTNRRVTTPTKAKTAARARAGPPSNAPPVPASEPPNPSVDKITTGMKKIKINLITQAQKEARARKQQQQQQQSDGKEELGKPKIQVDTSRRGRSSVSAEPTSSSSIADAAASEGSFLSRTTSDMSSPALDYSPADMSSPLGPKGDNARYNKSVSPSDFIAYQPDGPDAVMVSREEPLQWLAPNTATPSANTPVGTPLPAKKNGLFQYASGIPFAPRGSGNDRNDQPSTGDLKVKREPTA